MTIHIKKNGQQHQLLTIDKVNVRPKTRSTDSDELPPGRVPEDVWNSVLRTALALPGVKVDRKAFLRRALSKHVTEKVLQSAIGTSPAKAGVSKNTIRHIATASIKWHRAGVSALSFASGIPGGWWIAGTVPADLTQFFWHVLVILQKLAYLYGWPELFSEDSELDDETLLILTVFIGVMLGAESAAKILGDIAERAAAQVIKRLPREALTKWGLYRLAREVANWIGIKLTKDSFARYLSRIVPILAGIISGTVTWISFSLMTSRLAAHLESLPLAASVIKRRRNDRPYVRRNKNGDVKKKVNVGLFSAAERRRKGKTKIKPAMVIAEM
ncbi:MAG: hypothetical protein DME62_12895 [Verrucomicrobia bacterium]|nr:MAG: hypothetical protein DME62_12895 [Verrucomicrobiota bacterium]